APRATFWLALTDGTRVPIQDEVTIGRGETNTVVLSQDRQVSRHHARIVLDEGLPRLEDLGSANGTFVNGERVLGPRLLQVDDEIRVGGTCLRLQSGAPSPQAETPQTDEGTIRAESPERTLFVEQATAGSDHTIAEQELGDAGAGDRTETPPLASAPLAPLPSTDRPRLNVTWGSQSGQSFVLDREVVLIGRAGGQVECDIALDDKAVSSPHAKLVRSGDVYLLHDLESTNGTYVNYERLSQPRVLADGDLLKVGRTTLLYRTPVATWASTPPSATWPTLAGVGRGKLLTFFSLKGGVGTTTVAVNTALLIRELTREPTVLVDLALERASVTAQLNLEVRRALDDLAQLPAFDADTVRGIVTHYSSGLDVLAAPNSPQTAELVTAELLAQLFPLLKQEYRWVILDTAAAFSDVNLNAFDQSDLVVLVGAPDLVSLKTLQSCLDVFTALQTTGERRLVLLNNLYPKARLERDEMEKALGERIDLVLPYGEEVLHSIDLGVPLAIGMRTHPFIAGLEGFVRKVAEIREDVLAPTRAARGGFWLRLKRLLARR
ncbi:MAG: FHA domain-containing protein, partial [Chloroflexi bacterium]|nr:FHA domain-containing protein [Chloroflexota bacterium]